jgi:membrane protease YdiL (CAAX protease family)
VQSESESPDFNGIRERRPSRGVQAVELLVVLLVMTPLFFPSRMWLGGSGVTFPRASLPIILQEVARTALILYLLWRNGERISAIGWTVRRPWPDVALGAVGYVPVTAADAVVGYFAQALGFRINVLPSHLFPRGAAQAAYSLLPIAVVGITQEITFRGYLLLRFAAVTRSLPAAVVLSSVLFALIHTYQGFAGVVSAGVGGLLFALLYLWRRSLLAPIVLHFVLNLGGITVAGLLMKR